MKVMFCPASKFPICVLQHRREVREGLDCGSPLPLWAGRAARSRVVQPFVHPSGGRKCQRTGAVQDATAIPSPAIKSARYWSAAQLRRFGWGSRQEVEPAFPPPFRPRISGPTLALAALLLGLALLTSGCGPGEKTPTVVGTSVDTSTNFPALPTLNFTHDWVPEPEHGGY